MCGYAAAAADRETSLQLSRGIFFKILTSLAMKNLVPIFLLLLFGFFALARLFLSLSFAALHFVALGIFLNAALKEIVVALVYYFYFYSSLPNCIFTSF